MSPLPLITTPARTFDFTHAFGLIFMGGLIFLGLLALLAILTRLAKSYAVTNLQAQIRKHGLKEVIIREVDSQIHDDTLANTLLGHHIAGTPGAILGALSGSQWERIKSIRFWIKLGNGEKREITLKPKDDLCEQLLRFMDDQDYQAW